MTPFGVSPACLMEVFVELKVTNLTTGEVLLESDDRILVSVSVDGRERVIVTVTEENISTYLRDLIKDRADIKIVRSRFGLFNRMEI